MVHVPSARSRPLLHPGQTGTLPRLKHTITILHNIPSLHNCFTMKKCTPLNSKLFIRFVYNCNSKIYQWGHKYCTKFNTLTLSAFEIGVTILKISFSPKLTRKNILTRYLNDNSTNNSPSYFLQNHYSFSWYYQKYHRYWWKYTIKEL